MEIKACQRCDKNILQWGEGRFMVMDHDSIIEMCQACHDSLKDWLLLVTKTNNIVELIVELVNAQKK